MAGALEGGSKVGSETERGSGGPTTEVCKTQQRLLPGGVQRLAQLAPSVPLCHGGRERQRQDQKGLQEQERQSPAGVPGVARQDGTGELKERHHVAKPAGQSQREG